MRETDEEAWGWGEDDIGKDRGAEIYSHGKNRRSGGGLKTHGGNPRD